MAEINIICPCQIYANCKNTVVCIYNGKITTGLITNQKKRRKLERMKSICIQCDRSIRYIDVLNFPLGHGNFSNFSMSMCNEFKWVEDNTRHRLIEIKRQIDRYREEWKTRDNVNERRTRCGNTGFWSGAHEQHGCKTNLLKHVIKTY